MILSTGYKIYIPFTQTMIEKYCGLIKNVRKKGIVCMTEYCVYDKSIIFGLLLFVNNKKYFIVTIPSTSPPYYNLLDVKYAYPHVTRYTSYIVNIVYGDKQLLSHQYGW